MALGSHESVMTEQVWRRSSRHHGRYLLQLAEWGYELSEIEQLAEWGYELSEIEQSVIDMLARSDGEDEEESDVRACRECGCTDEESMRRRMHLDIGKSGRLVV
jgi:hypothetical protein